MRSFSVPFDLNAEEKVVGGYLTLKQTMYLVLTGIAVLAILLSKIGGSLADMIQGKVGTTVIVLKLLAAIVFIILGCLFMYLRPHGMSFAKYLKVRVAFMRRNKKINYER